MTCVVYLCNNVDAANWGCRATSTALLHAIERSGATVRSFGRSVATTPIAALPWPDRGRTPTIADRATGKLAATTEGTPLAALAARLEAIGPSPVRSARALRRLARSHPVARSLVEAVHGADHVVINGEGSMIFTSPPRRDLRFQLAVAQLAIDAGVPVHHVNAGVSPCPRSGTDARTVEEALPVLAGCRTVQVREPVSEAYLRELGHRGPVAVVPDALFTWAERGAPAPPADLLAIEPFPERQEVLGLEGLPLPARYVCVSGASVPPGEERQGWTDRFTATVEALRAQLGIAVVLVEPCAGDGFLREVGARTGAPVVVVETPIVSGWAVLAGAEAYLTGRYHPSILAALAGVPLVHVASNSHKLLGLRSLLGPDADAGRAADLEVAAPDFVTAAVGRVAEVLGSSATARAGRRDRATQLGAEADRALQALAA